MSSSVFPVPLSGIQEGILNAKGDLIVASAADVPAILTAAATDGYILSTVATAATGLEWIANDQGDLTAVSAGTGISVTDGSGPIPTVAIDSTVATTSGTETFTNKTLTSPIVTIATNAQVATYTAVLTDASKLVTMDVATANDFLIPTNANVAFPVGTVINVVQIGAETTTIEAVTPGTTTIESTGATTAAPDLRAQFSAASCIKVATDTWYVVGDIA
jgi:hypothetical protein